MLEGYYGETSLQTHLVLVLYTEHLLLTGVENRPLVPPVCFFFCASVGAGELASHGNSFLSVAADGRWFSLPHPETECSN